MTYGISGEERARILAADDANRNLKWMQALLTLAGYNVVTALDGEEVLQKVREEPPDLVLLDSAIPKLSGYEVCARLKANEKTRLIPVILIAPSQELEDRIRGMEVGSDNLLQRPINRAELLAQVESLIRVKRLNDGLVQLENTILSLAIAVEAKDPYTTEGHIERVAAYAAELGRVLGLPPREQELLRKGGLLHDVGKVGIRESVILKPGPLTQEEFEHIKTHTLLGERICQPLGQDRMILDAVRHHHERYDGKGYPDGLRGEDIPLSARIMALADAYDALTNDRPYRKRFPQEDALAILKKEASYQFDPILTPTFLEMFEVGLYDPKLAGQTVLRQ